MCYICICGCRALHVQEVSKIDHRDVFNVKNLKQEASCKREETCQELNICHTGSNTGEVNEPCMKMNLIYIQSQKTFLKNCKQQEHRNNFLNPRGQRWHSLLILHTKHTELLLKSGNNAVFSYISWTDVLKCF